MAPRFFLFFFLNLKVFAENFLSKNRLELQAKKKGKFDATLILCKLLSDF
jgi:hypothetical protein